VQECTEVNDKRQIVVVISATASNIFITISINSSGENPMAQKQIAHKKIVCGS